MSIRRCATVLTYIATGTATAALVAGLTTATASASPIQAHPKASLGSIFSCKQHDYPWC